MTVQTVLDPINDLIEQAKRVLPGGSFGNMPAEVVLREGKGGRIWDEAGREYVTASPCANLPPLDKEHARERVLDANEIRIFWHGLDRDDPPRAGEMAAAGR